MIYVIQAGDAGPVKIGIANDVRKRVATIQVSCPYPVRILHVFEGGAKQEGALHRRFAEHRQIGEWFAPIPEILAGDFGLPVASIPSMERRQIERVTVVTGLEAAIAKVGSASALGRLLGVERSAVYLWRNSRVPAERVSDIEAKVGIPRHQIRPDLYPAPMVTA